MKKEIGSIFPLNNEVISDVASLSATYPNDRIYYSLCREALFDIAQSLADSNKIVMIPAYTCQTVITPFQEAGWKCIFYSIYKNLRIDVQNLTYLVSQYHPVAMVVHPYFGMELNAQEECSLQQISEKGVKIILDLTQCLFSVRRYPFITHTVGSYRKWFPIPDGGFLERNANTSSISKPESEHTEFTDREIAAMYLRGQYFGNGERRTKEISIRLSKAADHIAESNIAPHRMSSVAYNLLQREDMDMNQKSRYDNNTYLFQNICENNKVTKVCQDLTEVTTAPLYFTIYVQDRKKLQQQLAQDSIYAPVIWPVEDERVLINDDVRYIYDHLLAIPCDQRYNTDDMQRAVAIINNY